jgi:RNA polymerase sigma factor (sigma-70 family)
MRDDDPADREIPVAHLVALARGGDRDAFSQLVTRHGEALLRFVRRFTRDGEEALDVFQDTCLRAFRSLGALRDPSAFRGWLAVIALNCLKRRATRSRRTLALERAEAAQFEIEVAGAPPPPERAEAIAALHRAVADLPPRQREVLAMRLEMALPFREIATSLGIREDNARACHYQALKTLRRRLHSLAREIGDAP